MRIFTWGILFVLITTACGEKPVPRPKAYFRIDLPEQQYKAVSSNCPFSFESPTTSPIAWRQNEMQKCWFNLHYPDHKAQIHFTYKPIESNLRQLLDESHQLSYEHHVKANDIVSKVIINDTACVYGLVYQLEGDVASPLQFYLTDSTNHFMRGSLYFNTRTNSDSLQPVVDFITQDVEHLISTLRWHPSRCD